MRLKYKMCKINRYLKSYSKDSLTLINPNPAGISRYISPTIRIHNVWTQLLLIYHISVIDILIIKLFTILYFYKIIQHTYTAFELFGKSCITSQ